MATPVLNNTLNTLLSVQPGSSASRAHDGERLADFSSLLRGQMQNGAKADTTRTFPARNEAVPNQASRHPQRAAEKPRADGAGNRCEPTPPAPTSASAPDTGNSGENPSASAAQDQDQASETPLPENASQPVQQTPGAPETPAAQASALSAAIAALLNKFADAANNEAALPTGEAVAETDALPLEKDSAREPTLAATAKLARAPILAAHATASPNTPAVAQSVTEAIVLTQRADAGNIQGARADGMARATGVDTGSNPGSNPLFSLRAPSQTASGTPQLPVQTPAGQRGWAEEIGNRVTWMLGRAQSKAELVLTPPNLGKVEVSINLNGDQTTAQFVASSQAARDALEQSMPRLRELLAQAGINLGQANVDTGEARREHETSSGHSSSNGGRGGQDSASDDELGQEDTHATRWIRQDNGLVNTFA